jgi:hypothetical protein
MAEDSLARLGLLGNQSLEYLELVGATEPFSAPDPLVADADEDLRATSLTELECLATIEQYVPTPDWAPPLSSGAYSKLLGVVAVYHAALPFAEPEHRWFYKTLHDIQTDSWLSIPAEVDACHVAISSLSGSNNQTIFAANHFQPGQAC